MNIKKPRGWLNITSYVLYLISEHVYVLREVVYYWAGRWKREKNLPNVILTDNDGKSIRKIVRDLGIILQVSTSFYWII